MSMSVDIVQLEPLIKHQFSSMIIIVQHLIEQRLSENKRALCFTHHILNDFEFNYIEDGGFYTWEFIINDEPDYTKKEYLDTLIKLSRHPDLVYLCLCDLYSIVEKEILGIPTDKFADCTMNYLSEFVDLIESALFSSDNSEAHKNR